MDTKDEKFYDQACAYFHYHAGQRTDMINYFIAIFGACVALYGSFLQSVPIACVFIAVFLFIVTVLFYLIDLRTKFDVKQSQAVICAFEQKYHMDDSSNHPAYGVFSNEDNVFLLYDADFRKESGFYKLQKLHKKARCYPADLQLQASYKQALTEFRTTFGKRYPQVSEAELKRSLSQAAIPHLSTCFKVLYYICMVASLAGFGAALYLLVG